MAVAENLRSTAAVDMFSGDLATLRNLADEIAATAQAEALAAQQRDKYARHLREYLDSSGSPVIIPPEGTIFVKQLGGMCMLARAKDWRDTTWAIRRVDTPSDGYFIGDQIVRRPTLGGMRDHFIGSCAAGLIRIRALDPAATEAQRPYYLLMPPQDIGGLLVASLADIPESQRFRPFAAAA